MSATMTGLKGNMADKVTCIHDYKSGQDNARCYERVQWEAGAGKGFPWITLRLDICRGKWEM